MRCPYCGSENSRVVDSRPAEDNNAIRRRRQCDECGKRFTTYEKIETEPLSVIKKDKTRQLYDRNKIRNGIVQSCHKLPVSMGRSKQRSMRSRQRSITWEQEKLKHL